MLGAVRLALEARARLGVTGVATRADVERAIADAGLGLRTDRPYTGRIQGRLYRRTVCLRRGLDRGTARVVASHELGHAVLGHDDGFFLRPAVGASRSSSGREATAQIYAWTFLLGRPAPTMDGLDDQIERGYKAGLPLVWLFTAASILTAPFPAVRGMPLLQLS